MLALSKLYSNKIYNDVNYNLIYVLQASNIQIYDILYRPHAVYNVLQSNTICVVYISKYKSQYGNLTQPTNLPPITATDFSELLVSDI